MTDEAKRLLTSLEDAANTQRAAAETLSHMQRASKAADDARQDAINAVGEFLYRRWAELCPKRAAAEKKSKWYGYLSRDGRLYYLSLQQGVYNHEAGEYAYKFEMREIDAPVFYADCPPAGVMCYRGDTDDVHSG